MELKLEIQELEERNERARAYSKECALRLSRQREAVSYAFIIGIALLLLLIL